MRRTTRIVALSMLGAALMLSAAATVPRSASSDELRAITLYTDPASGQVFTKRCKHCVRLGEYMPTGSTEEIEQKVERRVKRQTQQQFDQERAAMQAELAQRQAQQQEWNAEMTREVSTVQPFAQEFGDRWYKKISVGTLIYGNYGYWAHTGFGPQFTDGNQVWPGPGNNSFNEFAMTRAYLDTKFTPTDDISFRLTPEIYAMVNTGTTCTTRSSGGITTTCVASTGDKVGENNCPERRRKHGSAFEICVFGLQHVLQESAAVQTDARRHIHFWNGTESVHRLGREPLGLSLYLRSAVELPGAEFP
jgi:hypothetical protein